MEGKVRFRPLSEVLPKAGVLKFFPKLFGPHEVVLKFLHILNINVIRLEMAVDDSCVVG